MQFCTAYICFDAQLDMSFEPRIAKRAGRGLMFAVKCTDMDHSPMRSGPPDFPWDLSADAVASAISSRTIGTVVVAKVRRGSM